MADPTNFIQQTQTAAEYVQVQGCFHHYRDAPFRFQDQIERLQETIAPGKPGLVHQPGLLTVPLPLSRINLDFMNEGTPDLEIPNSPHRESIHSLSSNLVNDRKALGRLRFPSEPLNLVDDLKNDVQQYLNDISSKFSCNVLREWLPLSPVSAEKDEGLMFSSASSRWRWLALRELDREKIVVSEEAERMLKDFYTSPNSSALRNVDLGLHQLARVHIDPVSPPIAPSSDADSPFLPSPRVTVIDLTSDPGSIENPHVNKLRQDIEDGTFDSGPISLSMTADSPPLVDVVRDLIPPQCRDSDFKVDVPLTISSPSGAKGWASLSREVDFLNNAPHESESVPMEPVGFFDEPMEAILESYHGRAIRNIENERLKAAGSLLRMEVPNLNFDIADPKWHNHVSSSGNQFRWMKTALGQAFSLRPATISVQLGAGLKWAPIPHGTGRDLLKEILDSPGSESQKYLVLETPNHCSESYISYPQDLRILQLPSHEDIQPDTSSEDNSINSADAKVPPKYGDLFAPNEKSLLEGLNPRFDTAFRAIKRKNICDSSSLLPHSADSSTTTKLLSNFLQLRCPKKLRASNEPPHKESRGNHKIPATPITIHPSPQQHNSLSAPIPNFKIPSKEYRLIVSANLDRVIMSQMEKKWPQLEIVDKDFSQYDEGNWPLASNSYKERKSTLSFESDISVSPSVGILLTSLLKVKQKPLPGSNYVTTLQQRVQRVSEKYESLFVLVSIANPLGEYVGDLSESDKLAYSNFVQFTTSLQTDITVNLVHGAEHTLSEWILDIIARFVESTSGFDKLVTSEDTVWGLFLRRAGMNIFASQALEMLLGTQHGELGMDHFLSMSVEERIMKYSQVLGGSRVLRLVSGALGE